MLWGELVPLRPPLEAEWLCPKLYNVVGNQTGGSAADNWNAGFGISTDYGGEQPNAAIGSWSKSTMLRFWSPVVLVGGLLPFLA